MPVLERRKLSKVGVDSFLMRVPRDWVRFFEMRGGEELDTIADLPFIAFPPQIKSKEERIEALKKIIALIEATPEFPFPKPEKGKGKKQ